MNTDDERREYSRKNQEKNDQKIRRSTADLINTNGNLINKYQPNDIEELKKENTIFFCLNSKSIGSIIEDKFKTIKFVNDDLENGNIKKKVILKTNINKIDYKDVSMLSLKKCPTCFFTSNKKKSHYTIRRGPSKISHLLITDNNLSIKDKKAEKELIEESFTNDLNINLNLAINQYIDEEI